MKVSGVITEYNPFHNGHKYQLDKIREESHADYIIVAMSGNFVQRGTPAFIDKYTRAEMALNCGADLILEIPVLGATASAEGFARAGVLTLASTGILSTLCYGVEKKSGLLSELADFLLSPCEEFNDAITSCIKSGDSFPAARAKAVSRCFPDASNELIQDMLSTPNNILAIEYEKALKGTGIAGHQIERVGEGYHSVSLSSNFASASAIRAAAASGCSASEISKYMPDKAYEVLLSRTKALSGSNEKTACVLPDDLSQILLYKLLSFSVSGRNDAFCDFSDCTEELSAKIANNIYKYRSFSQFCDLLKSKNYTHTRISRVLTHILLDIKKSDADAFARLLSAPQTVPYLRVLGFKKSSSQLLHEIKEKASAPLITKVADASSLMTSSSYETFKKDIFASDIYRSLLYSKSSETEARQFGSSPNEYTQQLVIVP